MSNPPSWPSVHARAAELGLHIGRESPPVLLADIEDVSGTPRYARVIVPTSESVSEEARDALLRALVAAGIEAVGGTP